MSDKKSTASVPTSDSGTSIKTGTAEVRPTSVPANTDNKQKNSTLTKDDVKKGTSTASETDDIADAIFGNQKEDEP